MGDTSGWPTSINPVGSFCFRYCRPETPFFRGVEHPESNVGGPNWLLSSEVDDEIIGAPHDDIRRTRDDIPRIPAQMDRLGVTISPHNFRNSAGSLDILDPDNAWDDYMDAKHQERTITLRC